MIFDSHVTEAAAVHHSHRLQGPSWAFGRRQNFNPADHRDAANWPSGGHANRL